MPWYTSENEPIPIRFPSIISKLDAKVKLVKIRVYLQRTNLVIVHAGRFWTRLLPWTEVKRLRASTPHSRNSWCSTSLCISSLRMERLSRVLCSVLMASGIPAGLTPKKASSFVSSPVLSTPLIVRSRSSISDSSSCRFCKVWSSCNAGTTWGVGSRSSVERETIVGDADMPRVEEDGEGMLSNSGAEHRLNSIGNLGDCEHCPFIACSIVALSSSYLASWSLELAQTAARVRIWTAFCANKISKYQETPKHCSLWIESVPSS